MSDKHEHDKLLLCNYITLNTINYLSLPSIFLLMPTFYNLIESEDY
jgi:hypothetical protein